MEVVYKLKIEIRDGDRRYENYYDKASLFYGSDFIYIYVGTGNEGSALGQKAVAYAKNTVSKMTFYI